MQDEALSAPIIGNGGILMRLWMMEHQHIVQFFAKPTVDAKCKIDVPAINFQITIPDGTHYTKEYTELS